MSQPASPTSRRQTARRFPRSVSAPRSSAIAPKSSRTRSSSVTGTSTPRGNTAPRKASAKASAPPACRARTSSSCTKVSHEYLRADDFARSVDESLRNLQVDYVDLLHVHWPTIDNIPLAETMGALAKAKRDGKARHVGVANFNIALVEEAIRALPGAARHAPGRVPPLSRPVESARSVPPLGLVFTAYCPLARGRVFNDPVLGEIAKKKERTLAQIACAGSCSRATSPRFRARPTPSTWPKASRCSTSS